MFWPARHCLANAVAQFPTKTGRLATRSKACHLPGALVRPLNNLERTAQLATRNFSSNSRQFNRFKWKRSNHKRNINNGSRLLFGTGTSGFLMGWTWLWSSDKYDRSLFMAMPVSGQVDGVIGQMSNYNDPDRFHAEMELFIMYHQGKVCKALEDLENERPDRDPKRPPKKFRVDRWTRKEGGGGITCVMEDGDVFEKAGVNVSVVHGILPPEAVRQMKSRGKEFLDTEQKMPFFAAGISCVVHPRNPHVPTIHFNYRYFEVLQINPETGKEEKIWWFGGGTDLTPYVLHEEDVVHFHTELKDNIKHHSRMHYRRFKSWCDDYFHIKHRNERRGVGGIFFDDMDYPSFDGAWNFINDCAVAILPSYVPIVERNMAKPYTGEDREWQLIRRGRYAEFNLVYDRGTKFGLFTPGARIESILMSLPLEAKWSYDRQPRPGTNEEDLMRVLKEPKDWIDPGGDRGVWDETYMPKKK